MPPSLTWLVRHGQSASNAGLPAVGASDVPLTALGHEQAAALAQRIDRRPDGLIVSKFLRSQDTAAPIRARWPDVPCAVWPIHELTYLSPMRCTGTTKEIRQPWVDAYWRDCDPDHVDGPDAESFRSFVGRLTDFHARLLGLDGELVVAVGHGQFFSAYLLGLRAGFEATGDWMRRYRAVETANPIANCAIIELTGAALTSR